MTSHQLKPVDFEFPNFDDPSLLNRRVNQYFVVCVPQTTDEDVQLYTEAREKYGRMVHLVSIDIAFNIGNTLKIKLLTKELNNFNSINDCNL